ncbi:regulator of nonsense transcripts 3B [Aricia agestis]|uniref:regulator of nonsense transcripts 3B n=1 Tax=Aricia agestis TaxID=91739 RepID=UPI001C201EDD|nr:regulator of nonsense transcripts 3B [Aricia agestis]
MTEEQDAKDSQSDSGSKTFSSKNKDKKGKTLRPLTKIIVRRLPPTMTEEAFLEQVSPIPEHDHFYFAKPDLSLGNNVYARAYINFVNVDDIYLFRDKFDGYVFVDEKGVEYVGIVEYAPFQRIIKKKKKKDPKCGTIESDPVYQEFIENLNKEQEPENQPKLEYSYPVNDTSDKKIQTTPLLEYLASRKLDKRGRDERRRRENDKRKMRIERKTKDIKEEEFGDTDFKKIKPRDWEKDKIDEDSEIITDSKDGLIFESKTYKERKNNLGYIGDKKKRDEEVIEDKKDRRDRDKAKEIPREAKSKKYSDTRKERFQKIEPNKPVSKIVSTDVKPKLNHDDIKPFTQLPQVKTDNLSKFLDTKDRKPKVQEVQDKGKEDDDDDDEENHSDDLPNGPKMRRNSLDFGEFSVKDTSLFKKQASLEDRSKSTDREDDDKEKSESGDRRSLRRTRNKDRPSLPIYQPGMGKFSKQRLAKEKEPGTKVNDGEKKDT